MEIRYSHVMAIAAFAIALAVALFLAGCVQNQNTANDQPPSGNAIWGNASTPNPTSVATATPEKEKQASELAENLLVSISTQNYSGFTQNLSARFKAQVTYKAFFSNARQLAGVSGAYVSKGAPSFFAANGLEYYSFPAKFEQDLVNTTVIINPQTMQVEGVIFDSPSLRALAQIAQSNNGTFNSTPSPSPGA